MRTPPFVGGRAANQRGAVPGSPAAPTPGMPVPVQQRAGAPGGAGTTGTPPRGGILGTLQDPNIASIALAAAQQLTRPRYPGETGMGNAVGAVTAGFNQLAQQRQLQLERERLALETKTKNDQWEREQTRKDADTAGTNARRTSQTAGEEEDRSLKMQVNETEAEYKRRMVKVAERNATSSETNANSLETSRGAEMAYQQERLRQAAEAHVLAKEKFVEEKRQFEKGLSSKEKLAAAQTSVDWAQVGVQRERTELMRVRAGESTNDPKLRAQAANIAARMIDSKRRNTVQTRNPPDLEKETEELTDKVYEYLKSGKPTPKGAGAGGDNKETEAPPKENDVIALPDGSKQQLRRSRPGGPLEWKPL